MRILINTLAAAGIETGGGYTIISGLLPRLVTLDPSNEYCLIVSKQNQSAFAANRPNVSYIVLPAWIHRGPFRIVADNMLVPWLVRKRNADLYFSPNDYLPPWLSCPSVVGAFNLLYYQPEEAFAWAKSSRSERWHRRARQVYYRSITPKSLLRADRVVAISHETRRVIMENIPRLNRDMVSVVYPGVPTSLISLRARMGAPCCSEYEEPTAPFILSTSAISPYKRFDLLIRSFAIFAAQPGVDHNLVIVGRSYYPSYGEELEELAATLGVSDRVVFRGFIPAEELVRLYSKASAFVLLSSCESFGFPALEAMAFGRPVIVSNRSSLREIVGDGGLTVDAEDVQSVAALMHRVVTDDALSRQMSESAIARAEEFSWDEAARAVIRIFQDTHGEATAVNRGSGLS